MLGRRYLEMTWRDALFCHWAVEPAVVEESLPDRLSVATHEGDAYLGVVGFEMEDIRPRGAPVGLSFPELNLRTYVAGPDGPGIYFYNLDAEDRLGVSVARRLFALPYYRAEMDLRRQPVAAERGDVARDGPAYRVHLQSDRVHPGVPSAEFDATYEPVGEVYEAESGSLNAFLVENYRFYAQGNRLYAGVIDHAPWPLQRGEVTLRTNTLFEANGFDHPGGDPIVHYSEAVDVTADRIRRS